MGTLPTILVRSRSPCLGGPNTRRSSRSERRRVAPCGLRSRKLAMHILILGAAGMVGRKLIDRLARDGGLNGAPIDRLTLIDVVSPAKPSGIAGKVETIVSDLSAPGEAEKAVAARPDVIFHLAAIVSGEA